MITLQPLLSSRLRSRIGITVVEKPAAVDPGKVSVIFSGVLSAALLTLLSSPAVRASSPTIQRSGQSVPDGRIDLSHARPVGQTAVSLESDESDEFRQTGYFDQPLGCDSTVYEPLCGCETVCDCSVGQAYQQVYGEPVYGSETSCGVEASCGLETSCGVQPWVEPGCGVEGCDTIGCGGCCNGLDPNCGCNVCRGGFGGFLDGVLPRLAIPWHRMDLYAGVSGYTGPMNFANVSGSGTERVGAGSFGFYEGYNNGLSLKFFGTDLAYQSGARFLQSNLSGAGFTDESRAQIFLTSGLFRRVDYGLQYGLVVDYLYDDWYYRGDLIQLRGELSWVMRNSHVLGLKFAAGVDDDVARTSVIDSSGAVVRNDIAFESVTQYRLFYRQQLARMGLLEGFAGWTDQDDGLLGMELDLPIHGNLLWNTSATYLIPDEGTGNGGHVQEGWNLMIGFTYRPGGLGRGSRYDRPLLKVADNGTMIVDRK